MGSPRWTRRLAALAARVPPHGGEACRGWSCLVVDLGLAPIRPERCPGCGRAAPFRRVILGQRPDGPQ